MATLKTFFYLTLFTGFYFLLAFTGVFANADSKVVGAVYELLTIPLIVWLAFVTVFSLYGVLIKRNKINFYSLASVLISAVVMTTMFAMK
jgi:hypothetical protein